LHAHFFGAYSSMYSSGDMYSPGDIPTGAGRTAHEAADAVKQGGQSNARLFGAW